MHTIDSLAFGPDNFRRDPERLRASVVSAVIGNVLRESDRARTPESKIRIWSRSLVPIDSIG